MPYTAKDISKNRRLYNTYYSDDGLMPSEKKANFEELLKLEKYSNHPLDGLTVLDCGCGTGDFALILMSKGAYYTGIDIHGPALLEARKKYPNAEFLEGDFLDYPFEKIFDFAFLSGAINIKLPTNNYTLLEESILKMWSFTKVGIALNFLVDTGYKDEYLFFFDLTKAEKIIKNSTKSDNVQINFSWVGYPENDLKQANVHVWR